MSQIIGKHDGIRVVGVEEFPDWVDLIALGALVVQGVVQGTLWTYLRGEG